MRHSLLTYMYRILLISYLESSLPLINIKTNSLMEYDVIVFTVAGRPCQRSNNNIMLPTVILYIFVVLQSLVREPAIINLFAPLTDARTTGTTLPFSLPRIPHYIEKRPPRFCVTNNTRSTVCNCSHIVVVHLCSSYFKIRDSVVTVK